MPAEIMDVDLFMKLAEKAEICRVVRHGDEVKLKLRTPQRLYTMKVVSPRADELLKNLKCKVVDLTRERKGKQKEGASTPHERQGEG
mgnify:CR=1 FL=1